MTLPAFSRPSSDLWGAALEMIRIRKPKPSEAQKIRLLETHVYGHEVTNRYDMPMTVRHGYSYIAKDEHGKLVGAILALPTKDGQILVCDWVVDKRYRRKRIGCGLYERLLKSVKGKQVIAYIKPRNKASLNGHLKLGFKVYKRVRDAYNLGKGEWILVRLRR